MSKNKETLLALIAYASAVVNNPLLNFHQKEEEFDKFHKLWLSTNQKVRDQFVKRHPNLFEKVNKFRFEAQHPAYAVALKNHRGNKDETI